MTNQDAAVVAAQSLIDGIRNLPTPPPVFHQIITVVNSPDTSAYDVAKLLSEDPAMTAKVLKITNSAYYGLSGTVTSVKQAIVIIGLEAVRSLVLSSSLFDMFKGDRIGRDFHDRFWRHSLVTAFGSRLLMREICTDDFSAGELAFTTGLLHDIGKIVMYLHSPADCQRVIAEAGEGEIENLEAERATFGFDHALVGGVLATKWNLPASMSQAIMYHHSPLAVEDPLRLTDVVHLADGLTYHSLEGGDELSTAPAIEPGVFDRTGLRLEDLGDYVGRLKKEYIQAETFLKMAGGSA